MGQIIDMGINFERLMDFAEKSLQKNETVECALNLNEALDSASCAEERMRVYSLFIKCFQTTGNVRSVMDVAARDAMERPEEFFRMDFDTESRAYGDYGGETPDYDELRKCNLIKNLLWERKYDEAMALLSTGTVNYDYMDGVVEALEDSLECDENLDLDKYIMPLMTLTANAPCQLDMLQIMLEGGKATRSIMIDSADLLLEEEDSNLLCLMGIAYFQSSAVDAAKKFFLKALSMDPIDEEALYYMTVIELLTGHKDGGKKYWDRYKQVYRITEPPIRLLEEFLASEEDRQFLVSYQTLPQKFMEMATVRLLSETPIMDIDDNYAANFAEYAKIAPDQPVVELVKYLGCTVRKPRLQKLYTELLMSSRVACAVKEVLVNVLAEDGYEGDLCVLTDRRLVKVRFAKLHRRVSREWGIVYKELLKIIPFCDVYIPLNCSVLSAVVKRLDGLMILEEEDMDFARAMVVINYRRRMRLNMDARNMMKSMDFDTGALDRGLAKFKLETFYV